MNLPLETRRLLGSGLVALGVGLVCASCSTPILRDGNQPLASGVGVLGLSCVVAGWISRQCARETLTEARVIRLGVFFEHLAYGAGLLMFWTTVERRPFFVDTPFGRDILTLYWVLTAALAAVIVLSVASRRTLRKAGVTAPAMFPFPASLRARWALALGLIATASLNAAQAEAMVHSSDGMEISILSRGFPLPAFQKLRLSEGPKAKLPQEDGVTSLTLPNGTHLDYANDTITITRYVWLPKKLDPGVRRAELSDGTSVEFAGNNAVLSLGHGTSVVLNLAGRAASFVGGTRERVDIINSLVDLLIGLALVGHCAVCTERIQRAVARSEGQGG